MHRLIILIVLLGFGPALVLRADNRPSADAIADGLTCQCGCGLTVANCNHPQCEFSVPVRTQIEAMIARGLSGRQILASYRAKYGEKILSSPTTSGFNLVAWLMPFGAIFAGGGLIFMLFGRWRSRPPPPTAPADGVAFDPALREQLEGEVKHDL
ncbi:MAG TPA: cytochrome c-type biogenesis protein CcmH [Candidatus Binataceae bacterium]|nr:cytochrome c-type biogenesis protein CcmH [Candidatus Binataceae bacterium]